MTLRARYKDAVARGLLKKDAAQEAALEQLAQLAIALKQYSPRGFSLFRREAPRGLYIWGDVGRGKSMLMDMFFAEVKVKKKRRAHFNSFMVQTHARIHAERQKGHGEDPIGIVAKMVADEASLLCFDEFQVTDIADAMILGRLFEHLLAKGVVLVATSNTPPQTLYEGGLNRQLFLPFIALIEKTLDVIALNGPTDYRLQRMAGIKVYLTPLGPDADAGMDAAWLRLTDEKRGAPMVLEFLGRKLRVPQAAKHVARFSFQDLCAQPLAAPDYLEIAQEFHTVMIDHIPQMTENMRNEARRFILLIDTLYDEGAKLVCSAAAPPEALYIAGEGAEAFRRTASRLAEMQSEDYLKRGHGVHGLGILTGEEA